MSEFVERLRAGEAQAWAELLQDTAPRLMHYFERLGVDHHLAEDVIQETMATVYSKLPELRDASRFGPWLNTIARNRLRSRLRVRRLFVEVEENALMTVRDAAEALAGAETGALIHAEIASMPPIARRLVELRVVEGRAPEEVARILGMPRPLQRRRLHAALKTLRGKLRVRLGRNSTQIPLVSTNGVSRSNVHGVGHEDVCGDAGPDLRPRASGDSAVGCEESV